MKEKLEKDLAVLMIVLSILLIVDYGPEITGQATLGIGVTIKIPSSAAFRESVTGNMTFNLSINNDSLWYNYSENFTLRNPGTSTLDVFLSASDIESLNGSDYINVARDNGSLQAYIPGDSWYYIPDNNDQDIDSKKDSKMLCIANNLQPDVNVSEFLLRARTSTGSGPYILKLDVLSMNINHTDICSTLGEYYEI